MKAKISVSIGEDTLMKIRDKMRQRSFRNKSHLIEHAVNLFLENESNEVKDG